MDEIEGNDRANTFLLCAISGDVENLKELLDEGVDINVQAPSGSSALHLSVKNGHFVAVAFLIESGADVNIKCNCGLLPDDIPDLLGDSNAVNICICQWMVKHCRQLRKSLVGFSSDTKIFKTGEFKLKASESLVHSQCKRESNLSANQSDYCEHLTSSAASYLSRATAIYQKYSKISDSLIAAENTVKVLTNDLSAVKLELEKAMKMNENLKKEVSLLKDKMVLSGIEAKQARTALSEAEKMIGELQRYDGVSCSNTSIQKLEDTFILLKNAQNDAALYKQQLEELQTKVNVQESNDLHKKKTKESKHEAFKNRLLVLNDCLSEAPIKKEIKVHEDGSFFSSASASLSDLAYSCESDKDNFSKSVMTRFNKKKLSVHNDDFSDETTNASTCTVEKRELQLLQEKHARLHSEFIEKSKQYDVLSSKYKAIKLARKKARAEAMASRINL